VHGSSTYPYVGPHAVLTDGYRGWAKGEHETRRPTAPGSDGGRSPVRTFQSIESQPSMSL